MIAEPRSSLQTTNGRRRKKTLVPRGLRFECTQCGDCCTGAPGYVWVNKAEISAWPTRWESRRSLNSNGSTFAKSERARV